MTPTEANVLLTKAALIDPRLKRVSVADQADMAEAWAELLHDIELPAALAALHVLQRRRGASEPAIQPADILDALDVVDEERLPLEDLDPEWLLETKRRALAEFGHTVEEYDADSTVRADVAARWARREIERTQALDE